MYAVATLIVVALLVIYTRDPRAVIVALVYFALADRTVHGGASDLATYTAGPFKRIPGAYTTMGESACRAAIYLETGHLLRAATGASVPWLRYRGVDLELDGIDLPAALAFEYDGPQHHSYRAWLDMLPAPRRRTTESALVLDFYRSRFYDRVKTRLCDQHAVRLIRVPAAPLNRLRTAVRQALATPQPSRGDDAEAIDALIEVDTRDSTAYPRLHADDVTLVIPGREWHPHPFHMPTATLYLAAWRRDLSRFVAAVGPADRKKIIAQVRALPVDPDQCEAVVAALQTAGAGSS